MTGYTITLHTGKIIRTSWWKDEDAPQPADVWWLSGGGLNRPATDVEKDLWKRILELEQLSGTDNQSVTGRKQRKKQ